MTGGTVVVLGATGRNFAAGMSGGIAYVFDESASFPGRCNLAMVALEPVLPEADQRAAEAKLAAEGKGRLLHLGKFDELLLRDLIDRHLRYTASSVALRILDNWDTCRGRFVKVFPTEYKRALTEMAAREARAAAAKQLVGA